MLAGEDEHSLSGWEAKCPSRRKEMCPRPFHYQVIFKVSAREASPDTHTPCVCRETLAMWEMYMGREGLCQSFKLRQVKGH